MGLAAETFWPKNETLPRTRKSHVVQSATYASNHISTLFIMRNHPKYIVLFLVVIDLFHNGGQIKYIYIYIYNNILGLININTKECRGGRYL